MIASQLSSLHSPAAAHSTRKRVVSLALTGSSYANFIDEVMKMGRQRTAAYVCFANAHMVVEAVQNPAFGDAVNAANWVAADGVPLTWALRFLYGQRQERITGLDVMPTLLSEAARAELSVYVYGSTPSVLHHFQEFCATHHPSLQIAGTHSPPFRDLTPEEETRDIEAINASGAQLVFVALGCPKQEKWMAATSSRIQAVLLGVGGALPVSIGLLTRAPEWMQRNGLEWLHRFLIEPRRLFARYFVTNSLFLYYVARQRAGFIRNQLIGSNRWGVR